MKRKQIWIPFIVISAVLLSACDKGISDGVRKGGYWYANSLVHRQLKGPVKTLKMGSEISEFDRDGNLVEIHFETGSDKFTYKYINGKLITYTADLEYRSVPYVMNFEYKNPGKFVPMNAIFNDVIMLVPGLSATYDNDYKKEYKFGDSYMWTTYARSNSPKFGSNFDTTEMTYIGNYPRSSSVVYRYNPDTEFFNDFEYDSEGNLKKYVVGKRDTISFNTMTYDFVVKKEYLLVSKIKDERISRGDVRTVNTVFTYNEDGSVRKVESNNGWCLYNYENDAHGNWIKRRSNGQWASGKEFVSNDSREIGYYD